MCEIAPGNNAPRAASPLPSTSCAFTTSPESPFSDKGYNSPTSQKIYKETQDIPDDPLTREWGPRLTGQWANFSLDTFRSEKEEYKKSFRQKMDQSIHKIHGHRKIPSATCDAPATEVRRKRDPHRQHRPFQVALNKYAKMENTAEELEVPERTPKPDTTTSTTKTGKPTDKNRKASENGRRSNE